MNIRARMKERAVKQALMRQLRESGVDLRSVAEWLWEDFGKKVRLDWDSVESSVVGDAEITPQDVAVFMLEEGVAPDEGAWSVEPSKGLPGRKGRVERG